MSAVSLANWNGVEMPLEDVKVSVLDRSFLFGDAVYEVIRVYRGRPFLFGEHLLRMQRSLAELRIDYDAEVLGPRSLALLAHRPECEGILYLHVSRGVAPRTHFFPEQKTDPNALIYVKEFGGDPSGTLRATGARTILVDDLRWKRCDIKSVNLLANCLASQAAKEAGCLEAILVDAAGRISEGSHTSVFGVRGGTLLTAPLGPNLLPGITRKLVVHIADCARIPVREEPLSQAGLSSLDELFLTGTTTEVMPVIQVGDIVIGGGRPGPVAIRLQEEYRKLTQRGVDFITA
jgi:D-alanine transaminase